MWHWLVDTMRENPAIPIFLTLGLGFWIGKLRYKSFSLGTVTSVLLVGVLVGQLDIAIPGPVKSVFFLMFLFAIGYNCGPSFAASLKGSGIKQVIFCVVICALCLVCTWGAAKILGYGPGEAAGLFAGAQTISAVIGIGTDTISNLHIDSAEKQHMIDMIPVCYAVTYVFGTIGSAWILGNLGPRMLGGLKKVKAETQQLEEQLNYSSANDDPAFVDANRPIEYRAYKITSDNFAKPMTVAEIEAHFASQGKRLFVERVKQQGKLYDPADVQTVGIGDEIVLSGRHESIMSDESWLGEEVYDAALLDFRDEKVDVVVSKKVAGYTIDKLRHSKFMYGVLIESVSRAGQQLPVLASTVLNIGDTLTIVGKPQEISQAAPAIGFMEKPSNSTDMVFVSLAIFIGALIGAITITVSNIPISLSTSGGALIAGLVFGWLRTRCPRIGGNIPKSAGWLLNNLGLNMFIAVIGITCGPSFVSGIKTVGLLLFVAGIVATTLPLIIGIILGDKVFKFPAPINLGCCAGSRTTTAALGAIQESLGSSLPAMGYTVTYAIGNTLLILMGVAMVLLFC